MSKRDQVLEAAKAFFPNASPEKLEAIVNEHMMKQELDVSTAPEPKLDELIFSVNQIMLWADQCGIDPMKAGRLVGIMISNL